MFGLGRKYGFFVMVLGAAILLAPVPAFADGAFGGLIASGREIFTGPVSYTHLDVYKRQARRTADAGSHRRFCRQRIERKRFSGIFINIYLSVFIFPPNAEMRADFIQQSA